MLGSREHRPLISVVVPAFNEAECLRDLCQAVTEVCRQRGWPFEIVLVDDGSTDETWAVIGDVSRDHAEVCGIRLSRNFGHQQALLAGLVHATGEAVITMDADLQHPPALIPEMVQRWRDGARIVSTRRSDPTVRTPFKRLTARAFYRLFSTLSGVELDYGKADYRLLDRQTVDLIVSLPESSLFLRGIVEWIGFSQEVIEYVPDERSAGRTKYSLRKMAGLALSGITSFSVVPLRLSLVVGLVTTILSLGYGVYAVGALISGAVVRGWTSIICLFTFLFGVQFIVIGVMSEYLAQAFLEIKRRPRFVVADTVRTADKERGARSDDEND